MNRSVVVLAVFAGGSLAAWAGGSRPAPVGPPRMQPPSQIQRPPVNTPDSSGAAVPLRENAFPCSVQNDNGFAQSHSAFAHVYHRPAPVQRETIGTHAIHVRDTDCRPPYRRWCPRYYVHPRWVWVEGYYRWERRAVWVDGYWVKRYVPPKFEPRCVNGRWVRILVQEGRYEKSYVEGHCEMREVPVWVPGYWQRVYW